MIRDKTEARQLQNLTGLRVPEILNCLLTWTWAPVSKHHSMSLTAGKQVRKWRSFQNMASVGTQQVHESSIHHEDCTAN